MDYKIIDGDVASPMGFSAVGVCCPIKEGNTEKKDLAFIYADDICNAAGIFTKNKVTSGAVKVSRLHLKDGKAQAIIANSYIANTCTVDSVEKADKMCELAAKTFDVDKENVLVASTGKIGKVLPIEAIEIGLEKMSGKLSKTGGMDAACAIMTTDTKSKHIAMEVEIDGKKVTTGIIAKGSGMIHINMGTMLSFATTDLCISSDMLKEALIEAADETYNMITVDRDTSTNDTLLIMASGKAGNSEIKEKDENYKKYVLALTAVFKETAKKIAGDGEGATKLLMCSVENAKTKEDARKIAKSVVGSPLLKAAVQGADANWGRVLCSAGYSGGEFDPDKIDVYIKSQKGSVTVCKDGSGVEFSRDFATEILLEEEVEIIVDLKDGNEKAQGYGCDLTKEYVDINVSYEG